MKRIIQRIENVIEDYLWDDYNWNEKRKHNDLILIPTGDGYGIGFHPSINNEKILNIAKELFKHLTKWGDFKIRMGIAKGQNIRHLDHNDKINLFGYGINLASRVVSVTLENQILVHETYAREILVERKIEELVEISEPLIIKHNETIKVYNYYKVGDFGNPEIPKDLISK